MRYLTDDAANAGYERGSFDRDSSVIERGVASLIKPDTKRMARSAEDGLLRTLIRHGTARSALKNIIDAREAVGSSVDVIWSSEAKAWLFNSLLAKVDAFPGVCDSAELRSHFAGLPGCPLGAFFGMSDADGQLAPVGSVDSGHELDYLFTELDDPFTPVSADDPRIKFEVQQYYSTLLRVSTTEKLNKLQVAMDDVLRRMDYQPSSPGGGPADSDDPREGGDSEALSVEFIRLAACVRDTSRTLQSLASAATTATSRHLQSISSNLEGGRLPNALQNDLNARLEELMITLGTCSTTSDEIDREGESVQDDLDRIERD
jgi:hypothetical protein